MTATPRSQLRARKHRESKIEAYKRRLRERHEIRKWVG